MQDNRILQRREALEEVNKILKICEDRVLSLEQSIRKTQNAGLKKTMQHSYLLNQSLITFYKNYYKRLLN